MLETYIEEQSQKTIIVFLTSVGNHLKSHTLVPLLAKWCRHSHIFSWEAALETLNSQDAEEVQPTTWQPQMSQRQDYEYVFFNQCG